MQYQTSLDRTAKIITTVVLVLFIFIGFTSIKSIFFDLNTKNIMVHILVLSLLFGVFIGSWIFAPKGYTVTPDNFIINKNIGHICIKRSDIAQVRILTPNEVAGTLRTFGVGGIFGYFGWFYIPEIGSAIYYTTRHTNLILITTTNAKKIVVSPNNLELLTQLNHL